MVIRDAQIFAGAVLSKAQFKVGQNADPESLQVIRAFFIRLGKKHYLIGVVENPEGETHLPIVANEGNGFEFFCGGEAPADEELRKLLYELFTSNKIPPNPAYCWRKVQRGGRSTGCKHALALLKAVDRGLIAPEVITLSSQQPSEETDLEERLWTLRFRANLLLVGEAGSGKTHLAFALARRAKEEEKAALILIQGSPAVEAPDLLGRYIKVGEEIRWVDGPLCRAFRLARKGRVVLIIDELPRIPAREQGILVASLFPITGKKRDWYVLNNPLNGEELWCPSTNLWVIATGNVGLGYSHSVISDQALQERFLSFHISTTLSKLEEVLKPLIASKGWDVERLLPSLLKLREVGEELTQRGELSAPPSLRVLKRAVELAQTEADLSWLLVHSFPASSPEEQEVWERAVRKALA